MDQIAIIARALTNYKDLMHKNSLHSTLLGLCWLLIAGLAPGVALAHKAPPCAVDYWVAPYGNDAASGDRFHPWATLEHARDVVRDDARRQSCTIAVNLREGTHRLSTSLVLDARDSGAPGRDVVYRAARGESPVLSGAVPVTGWSLHDPVLGIYRAYVGPQQSRQLYVNGRRAQRAQTEPYPDEYERTSTGYRFLSPGKPVPVWSNPGEVEAVALSQWKMFRCPVASVAGPDVVMKELCWHNANVFLGSDGKPGLWSFRLLQRFENAYEFLDEPGEWYLDSKAGWLYYMPLPDENLATAAVELPVLDALVIGMGTLPHPLMHVRFEGLTFAYATWNEPSGPAGYAADQSGFHLAGGKHPTNTIGHDQDVTRTPGNVRFRHARHIAFRGNRFHHLGGVALDFDTGSQFNAIVDNEFEDLSAAAIQLGGVTLQDHHPTDEGDVTRDNLIDNNLVRRIGLEYWDAAGIYIGFTARTTVSHNDIADVPWSGIAIGWGWGLLDQGAFPGLPGATQGQWGQWDTPSTSRGNRIVHNRIRRFLGRLWDGGAIYSQAAQGTSLLNGELIAWNVASGKRPSAGGNTFYTDGGSRYVTLLQNVSYDNPVGVTDFGPCGLPAALPWCALGTSAPGPTPIDRCSSLSLCWLVFPYGGDTGGCVPHGDLLFVGNYWRSSQFETVCSLSLTVNLMYFGNHVITGPATVPPWILEQAGRRRWSRQENHAALPDH